MANSTATILINLRDNATQGLQTIRQQINNLGQAGSSALGGLNTAAGGAVGGLTALINPAGLVAAGVAAIGAAAAAVVTSTLSLQNEFTGAMGKMQAQLGLTAEETTQYGEITKQVFGNNFGESMADAADAVAVVAQGIKGLKGPEIKEATEDAIRLKDAYGVEVSESVNAASALMSKFGLSSKEAYDFIAAGMQQGLNKSGDFLDSIGEYSTQFQNGGADAGQFFSVLKSGLGDGVLGTDKAADLFKEFTLRISDGSKSTGEALKALGIDADKLADNLGSGKLTKIQAFELIQKQLKGVTDSSERQNLAIALMGTQYEDLGQKAVEAITSTATSTKDLAGSTKKLDAQYNTLGSMLTGEWRKVQVALMPVGEMLLAMANEALPYVRSAIAAVTANIVPFIKSLQEIGTKSAPAINSLKPVFVQFQAAIVAVFNMIVAVWNTLLKPTLDILAPYIRGVFGAIGPILSGFLNLVKSIAVAITKILQGDLTGAFNTLRTGIFNAISGIDKGLKSVASGITATLTGLASRVVGYGANIVEGLVNGIQSRISGAIAKVREFGESILTGIRNVLDIRSPSKKTEEVGKFTVEGLGVGLDKNAPAVVAKAKKVGTDTGKAIQQGLSAAAKQEALEGLTTTFKRLVQDLQALTASGKATEAQSVSFTRKLEDLSKKAQDYGLAGNSVIAALRGQAVALTGQVGKLAEATAANSAAAKAEKERQAALEAARKKQEEYNAALRSYRDLVKDLSSGAANTTLTARETKTNTNYSATLDKAGEDPSKRLTAIKQYEAELLRLAIQRISNQKTSELDALNEKYQSELAAAKKLNIDTTALTKAYEQSKQAIVWNADAQIMAAKSASNIKILDGERAVAKAAADAKVKAEEDAKKESDRLREESKAAYVKSVDAMYGEQLAKSKDMNAAQLQDFLATLAAQKAEYAALGDLGSDAVKKIDEAIKSVGGQLDSATAKANQFFADLRSEAESVIAGIASDLNPAEGVDAFVDGKLSSLDSKISTLQGLISKGRDNLTGLLPDSSEFATASAEIENLEKVLGEFLTARMDKSTALVEEFYSSEADRAQERNSRIAKNDLELGKITRDEYKLSLEVDKFYWQQRLNNSEAGTDSYIALQDKVIGINSTLAALKKEDDDAERKRLEDLVKAGDEAAKKAIEQADAKAKAEQEAADRQTEAINNAVKEQAAAREKADREAEQAAKDKQKSLDDEIAKYQDLARNIVDFAKAFLGLGDDIANLFATVIDNVDDAMKAAAQFMSGDIVGGIATALKVVVSVGKAIVKAVVGQNDELAKSYKALSQSVKDSAVKGEILLTDSISNMANKLQSNAGRIGNFWDNLLRKGLVNSLKSESEAMSKIIEKYAETAKALFGSAASGLKSALTDYLSGKTDLAGLKEAFKKNVYEGVLSGIIDAVVNKAIIEGALGGMLASISEAIATGNIAEANRLLGQVGTAANSLIDSLDLSALRSAFSGVLGGASAKAESTSGETSSSSSLSGMDGMSSFAMSIPLYDASKAFGTAVDRFGNYVDKLVGEGIKVSVSSGSSASGYVTAY